jgi:hypothetical protein
MFDLIEVKHNGKIMKFISLLFYANLNNFFFVVLAISNILDSLEDMQYLTDYFDTDCTFLDEIFHDRQMQSLLEVKHFYNI